jgi:hypothetical protein
VFCAPPPADSFVPRWEDPLRIKGEDSAMNKILRLGLITAFAGVLVSGCGDQRQIPTAPDGNDKVVAPVEFTPNFNSISPPGIQSYPLIADGGDATTATPIGLLKVWNDGSDLYVRYELSGDWGFTETHLHVAASLGDVPQTKNNNPKPGQFEYAYDATGCESAYTYPPISVAPGTLTIAAHASVWGETATDYFVSGIDNVDVYDPITAYAPLGDVAWINLTDAVATWVHPGWTANVNIPGATWLSTTYYVEDAVNDSWRLFNSTVPVPGYPLSGGITMATSDNAEEVYHNGTLIGSYGEVQGAFVDDGEWQDENSYPFFPVMGANLLPFIVRNYAMAGGVVTSNPTGLIYKGEVTYLARSESAWASDPTAVAFDPDSDSDQNGYGFDFSGKNWAMYIQYVVPWRVEGDLHIDRWIVDGTEVGPDSNDRHVDFLAFYVDPTTEYGILYWDQTSNGGWEHVVTIDNVEISSVAGGHCAEMDGTAASTTPKDGERLYVKVCDIIGADSYENYWEGDPLWEYTIETGDVYIGP